MGKAINSDKRTEAILARFIKNKSVEEKQQQGGCVVSTKKSFACVCFKIDNLCLFFLIFLANYISSIPTPIYQQSKMNFMSFRYATTRNLQAPSSTSWKRYYDASVLHSPLRQIKLNPIYIIA